MNIWIKIAVILIIILAAIIVVAKYWPIGQPAQNEKTYYDVIKQDDKRLRAEPSVKETIKPDTVSKGSSPGQTVTPPPTQPVQTIDETKLVFKPLEVEEEVEADRLIEMAIFERKAGRLPVLSYGNMVKYCREVIQRFPGSKQDFQARRILADIPAEYRDNYKITADEIDLTKWPKK